MNRWKWLIDNAKLDIYEFSVDNHETFTVENRYFPYYVMSYIEKGNASAVIEGKSYDTPAGHLILIPSYTRHSHFIPEGQGPTTFLWWHFNITVGGLDLMKLIHYDPCQFALAGVRDSQLRLGDTCCISGLGAIGLMAAQMAKLQGAKTVIVSDPIAKRREIALKCGADYAIDPINEDAGLLMKRLTGNRGVDVVIETSGTYPGLQSALRGVAYGGRIAVVGWFGRDRGGFHLGAEAHMNNATVFFSRACSEPNPDFPRWNWDRLNETCWHLLSSGKINCEDVLDPVVSFEDAGDTYRKYVVENPSLSVKMGVKY